LPGRRLWLRRIWDEERGWGAGEFGERDLPSKTQEPPSPQLLYIEHTAQGKPEVLQSQKLDHKSVLDDNDRGNLTANGNLIPVPKWADD
jgi:hypothetical protein